MKNNKSKSKCYEYFRNTSNSEMDIECIEIIPDTTKEFAE